MLYGTPQPVTDDKKVMINFHKTANLTYMCRLIHNFLFNMVMPRLRLQNYVSDKDRFCMYRVMVGGKVNLLEIIFFYWMQAFKDRFNPKVKRNLVPFGILFTQIMRNVG